MRDNEPPEEPDNDPCKTVSRLITKHASAIRRYPELERMVLLYLKIAGRMGRMTWLEKKRTIRKIKSSGREIIRAWKRNRDPKFGKAIVALQGALVDLMEFSGTEARDFQISTMQDIAELPETE